MGVFCLVWVWLVGLRFGFFFPNEFLLLTALCYEAEVFWGGGVGYPEVYFSNICCVHSVKWSVSSP